MVRVLVLCDDLWHPARVVRAGLEPLAVAGFAFDWIEDAGGWGGAGLADHAVVLLSKANHVSAQDQTPWATAPVEAALLAYLHGGGGLLAVHSGVVGYDDMPLLRGALGGVFVSHPPQCPVTVTPDPAHPLCVGSAPFTLMDEHYCTDFADSQAEVFLTTTSAHGTEPGGWTRRVGAGRVCVLTPGHNLPVWLHPSFQALLGNALRWCGG